MKVITLIGFTLLSVASMAQNFVKADTLNTIPREVIGLVHGEFKKGLRVDFNGDERNDYIIEMTTNNRSNPDNIEHWITSDLKTFRKTKKYNQDHDFFWFINLDGDVEPEIFRATGYEDGIDYAIYDQDLKSGKEKLVSYVHPVIIDQDKTYWGYPWDITGMVVKKEGTDVFLRVSFDHDIVRDEVITIPDPTKKLPAVFFHGHSTQPSIPVGQTRNPTWVMLKELR